MYKKKTITTRYSTLTGRPMWHNDDDDTAPQRIKQQNGVHCNEYKWMSEKLLISFNVGK
jgi:hypothetical protein